MAMNIINLLKDDNNGLLSKIKIGNKVYELKDLVARESIETLAGLHDALAAKVGTVAEGENLAALLAALDKEVSDNKTELSALITALQTDKADKTQVAKDIADAVKAEADLRVAADNAVDERLDKVEAFFEGAAEDGEGLQNALDTLKEIQDFINVEGTTADAMIKDIAANKKAIEDEVKARDDADKAIDERLDAIDELLGEGGSVADQIEAAKEAAIEAANDYTDEEIGKLGDLAKKNEADLDLKALAHKDSATGTVAGETISGVKATGTGVTGVTLSDSAVEKDLTASGKFTPDGNVTGTVTIAEHAVPVVVTNNDAQAVITTGTGVSNASVTVTPSTKQVVSSFTAGSLPSFTEGTFSAGKLDTEDVTIAAHKHVNAGMDVTDKEMLVFTESMVEALTFKAVKEYVAPSKAADTWDAGSECTVETATVVSGIDSANASIEYEKVTGVTYKKAEENAAGTCAGSTVAIDATFTGSEGAVNVGGKYTDTNYTATANTGAVELAVGDITVAAKTVTVQ